MTVTDVFILDTSGYPYLARCYGGIACKANPDHSLLTAFFAALSAFANELNQNHLENVIFDELGLVFEQEDDIIVVVGVEEEKSLDSERPLAKKIKATFLKNDLFKNFDNEESLIVQIDELVDKHAMGDIKPLVTKRRRNFFNRLKSIFS